MFFSRASLKAAILRLSILAASVWNASAVRHFVRASPAYVVLKSIRNVFLVAGFERVIRLSVCGEASGSTKHAGQAFTEEISGVARSVPAEE